MACCQNCANGTGPCAGDHDHGDGVGVSRALALAPKAVLRRRMGALSSPVPALAGVSVAQGIGLAVGGFGGLALAGMFSKRSTVANVVGVVAGAWAGSVAVPAATDAMGI